MAEFDVKPQAQGPGSYVGMSEGIRSSADTSIATLFEGLADALGKGVSVVDTAIKDQIEADVFDAVDSVQAEFGIPEATDLQADAEEASFRTMPVGVQRAGSRLQTLQAAYASGDLQESHYWARMNSMVRQLRGKYPGYRAEIDQMVASVTGARPANALRQALFSEWNAATSKGLSEEDKFVNQNQDTIPPDYFQRKGTPQAYTLDEIRAYSAKKNQMRFEMETRSKQMTLEKERNSLLTDDVKRNFNADATQIVQSALMDVNTGVGKSFQEVQAQIETYQKLVESGSPADQQQIEQLRGAIPQLAMQLEGMLYQHYASDPNYAERLTESEVKSSIEMALRPVRLLQTALVDDNFGLVKSVAANIEAMTNDSKREVLRDIPQIRRLSALNDLVGSDVTALAMTVDPSGQSLLTKVLKDNAEAGMLLGETDLKTSFDEGIARGADASYYNTLASWDRVVDATLSGELPPDIFLNKVVAMFSPSSDQVMNDPRYFKNDRSRFEFFSKVASPSLSKKMMQLRDQGHVEAWDIYQRWVARNFTTLFMSKVQMLQGMVTDPNQVTRVTWNDASSRFDVDLRLFGDSYIRHPFQGSIRELNQALAVVRPIIEANEGSTGQEVRSLLETMGFDPSAPLSTPWMRALYEAVVGSTEEEEEDGSSSE